MDRLAYLSSLAAILALVIAAASVSRRRSLDASPGKAPASLPVRPDRRRDPAPPGGSCSAPGGSCSALDPVLEPSYNMRNVCKQSILLEEHLNNEKKRCRDCCKKHFLHIVGLAEEAVSLAGPGQDPLLAQTAREYDALLHRYLTGADPLEIADSCRKSRKAVMAKYVEADPPRPEGPDHPGQRGRAARPAGEPLQ